MKNNILIRNAAAIMTGLPGSKARSSARDIRIESGVITEMGNGYRPCPTKSSSMLAIASSIPAWSIPTTTCSSLYSKVCLQASI